MAPGQPQFVTHDEMAEFRGQMQEQYEQIRKLVTSQAIAIDAKIKAIQSHIDAFTSRRPDPAMLRDFWIKRIPNIQEDLKSLQITVARLKGEASNGK